MGIILYADMWIISNCKLIQLCDRSDCIPQKCASVHPYQTQLNKADNDQFGILLGIPYFDNIALQRNVFFELLKTDGI